MAKIHHTSGDRHRFHLLDALRGIAALLVFFWHVPQVYHLRGRSQLFMAVDFFFCLSGFIVPFAYEHRLEEGLSLKDYLIARFIRLYPTFFIGLAIGALPSIAVFLSWDAPLSHPFALAVNTALQLCLLPALAHQFNFNLFPFDFPAWSLFFEAIASVLYGAAVWKRLHRTPLVILSFGLCVGFFLVHSSRLPDIGQGLYLHEFRFALARVLMSFSAGVLILRITRRFTLPHLTGVAGAVGSLTVASVLIATLVSSSALLHGVKGNLIAATIIFPLLIFAGAHCTVPVAWRKACEWLGFISYPFYLFHAVVANTLATRPLYNWVHQHFYDRYYATALGFVLSLLLAMSLGPVANKLGDWLREIINARRNAAQQR